MKKTPFLAAIIMLTMIQAKAQTMMNMTDKQQALVAIAANEARGDMEALKKEVNNGFEAGLSISEIKEALSQLYAYTGFPRSLNALGAMQQVIEQRSEAGLPTEEGREADPQPADYDAVKQGTEVQTQLVGGQPFNYTFAPQTDYYLKAHLFGDIFARNNLSFADREIVTISAISVLSGCEPQLEAHVSGARNMGVTDAQLHEIPTILRNRVGEAEAVRCEQVVANVFGEAYQTVETVDFNVWPRGVENPYGEFFIGQSYLAEMDAVTNVTFEPRCRNNWHVHHKQVQVLICVAGRGWYQEWGKPAVAMTPGTVIAIPAEVKHWHGAAKDSWFQHLTYHKDVQKGASNEWLEPVTDEWYDQLPSNTKKSSFNPNIQATMNMTQAWDKTFPKSEKVEHRKVTFHNRYGIELAADMYTPKNAEGRLAAIAVSGPFGAVKEQSSGLYAQHMAERGFLAIAFDPSFTGESGGEPRRMASPDINTEDFLAAVDFLSTQENVDANRIGIIGICGFGGMAVNAAAIDPRIKATVASTMYDMSKVNVEGYFKSEDTPAQRMEKRKALAAQRTEDYKTGTYKRAGGVVDPLPEDAPWFVKDYYDYYKTARGYHERSGNSNDGWNVIGCQSFLNQPLLAWAQEIETPVLLIHGEKAHSRYFSEYAFEKMTGKHVEDVSAVEGNKELLIIPGATHVDLYDDKANMIPFDKIETFFRENL